MKFCNTAALLLLISPAFAQDTVPEKGYSPHRKGSLYFYWGYNREFFERSDIHFSGPNYDFTLYNVRAKDRPSRLNLAYLNPKTLSIPQYNYRIGYFLSDRFSISAGLDHMKYVMVADQQSTLSGVILPQASSYYAGSYIKKPIVLTEDFLMFEHTNGFNLATLEAEYLIPLFPAWKDRLYLSWNTGAGGFWVITKTDVHVMGDGMDNDFHLSGYAIIAKTGPRVEYNRRFFLSGEIKAGYSSLPDINIKNSAPEKAGQEIIFYEYYVVAGLYISTKKQSPRTYMNKFL